MSDNLSKQMQVTIEQIQLGIQKNLKVIEKYRTHSLVCQGSTQPQFAIVDLSLVKTTSLFGVEEKSFFCLELACKLLVSCLQVTCKLLVSCKEYISPSKIMVKIALEQNYLKEFNGYLSGFLFMLLYYAEKFQWISIDQDKCAVKFMFSPPVKMQKFVEKQSKTNKKAQGKFRKLG